MHIIFIVVLTSFILSIITGYLLIPILKKLKADQSISKYLERAHKSKNHTPTIGGLILKNKNPSKAPTSVNIKIVKSI